MASPDKLLVSVFNFSTTVLLIFLIVCIVLYLWTYYNRSVISGVDKKFVLVTGCDSGFGRETAIALDKLGFGVFATCLTKEGEESLEAVTSSRVFALSLDVTDSQRVKAVYERVKMLLPPDCGRSRVSARRLGSWGVIYKPKQTNSAKGVLYFQSLFFLIFSLKL